ncbi:hypothetical protein [Neobacillus ginsengisoli]|uniref:Prefoldin subunit 5 n=1 Tax=Neobacillus ginsengisoli TaxID=904295 RepID=A0ABT9XR24_9BACI|nr:hypothetical protein [Neobacillus ginsengisoli]MDQ0197951.1 prefoldin subunit 5 [Neobacillus ginsengisoli]
MTEQEMVQINRRMDDKLQDMYGRFNALNERMGSHQAGIESLKMDQDQYNKVRNDHFDLKDVVDQIQKDMQDVSAEIREIKAYCESLNAQQKQIQKNMDAMAQQYQVIMNWYSQTLFAKS